MANFFEKNKFSFRLDSIFVTNLCFLYRTRENNQKLFGQIHFQVESADYLV